tara:strand:- start:2210 stop:2956 length:747 start_codon:yes stop_codon:yes gene_type:complete
MAFKQSKNPISRKTSPLNAGNPFKRVSPLHNAEQYGIQGVNEQEYLGDTPDMDSSPLSKHGDKFRKKAARISERSGAERGDAYDYENPKVVELLKKAKEADATHNEEKPSEKDEKGMSRHTSEHSTEEYMARKDAAIKQSQGMSRKQVTAVSEVKGSEVEKVEGEKPELKTKPVKSRKMASTAKSKGIVSSEGRDGSNRQERKKRRQERRSIRKNKDLSASQKRMAIKESRKQQKDNVRGVKKEETKK